ncbi:MAG: redox-sensing transcriptional repressor Rex [Bacteroidales bacterium]|nr:redox-sensing transcriptional repressor Rex [Bacteroidales bacterium]
MRILPEKTVERLSEYRRSLYECLDEGKSHIFSHELADIHNITAVQVRRDIMFIGYSTSNRKGYHVEELISVIGKIIDPQEVYNVAVIGLGNLGKAISTYFIGKRPQLNLVATFDLDPKKIGNEINGVKCYSIDRLRELIINKNITVAILTVPVYSAKEMAKSLVQAGIKGILNFTTVTLNVPEDIYLEEYDMITSMEKVAYFVKNRKKKRK